MGRLLLLFVLLLASCKVTNNNLSGQYKMKDFPKSKLVLKSDSTFEFVQNYSNPYLHPFEHSDESYFLTNGRWTYSDKILTLNSTKDSMLYSLYTIYTTDTLVNTPSKLLNDPFYFVITKNNESTKMCNYVFYDTDNDTVPVLFVRTNKGDVSRMHGSMEYFSWDKSKKDTLQFFFFGYKPITIINSPHGETNYKICLKPEFKPNYFTDTKFKATGNGIKHIKSGTLFKK